MLDSNTSATMAGRLVLNDTTEILGSFAEISGAHVSEETALWRNTMEDLIAGDAVGLQGNFRTAEV